MSDNINTVIIDKSEFTIEDAREAAKKIFSIEAGDFYSLKNEKWYKHLLNALTFGSDSKQKVIKDIRSLSKLQALFMHVYYENYKDMDSQLNEVINNLTQTNIVVRKLYLGCRLGIRPQEELEKISEEDKDILLLTLNEYKTTNNRDDELQKYKASVATILHRPFPDGTFNSEILGNVNSVDAFYKCLVEMKAIDYASEMPSNILLALEHLNISNKARKRIDELVNAEVECFGIDYMLDKYSKADENYWSDIEFIEKDDSSYYTSPEGRDWLEISNECAQIYFKDCYSYDKNKFYIETASYVVFPEKDSIYALHKVSGKKETLLNDVSNVLEIFKSKAICANHDMLYYVYNNNLNFIDIETRKEGIITHIEEIYDNDNGKLRTISNMSYLSEEKIAYYYTGKIHILSLQNGEILSRKSLTILSSSYFVRDNALYFLDSDLDIDNIDIKKNKGSLSGYVLKKYCVDSDEIVNVSKMFAKRDIDKEWDKSGIKAQYDVVSEGLYNNYYYVIFEYNSLDGKNDRLGFDCFYININNTGNAEAKNFYIWQSHVMQIEQFGKYLVYVNGSKGYKLIKHDFINDKKETLLKNCGSTEKVPMWLKLVAGKDGFMNANPYMRLGKWIWIKQEGKTTPKILSV